MKSKMKNSSGKGLIQAGGDHWNYLGHMRGGKEVKEGHNQGVPPAGPAVPATPSGAGITPVGPATPAGGADSAISSVMPAATPPGTRVKPAYSAALNPARAQRQAGRAAMKATPAGGGARRMQRAENKAAMTGARKEAKMIPMAERQATAKIARTTARKETQAGRQQGRVLEHEANKAQGQAKRQAVGEAKAGVQKSVGDVRAARENIRTAIQGGNVSGVQSGFGALKTARGERKSARQGVRQARKGK